MRNKSDQFTKEERILLAAYREIDEEWRKCIVKITKCAMKEVLERNAKQAEVQDDTYLGKLTIIKGGRVQ